MSIWGWILILVVVGVAAGLQYYIHKEIQGPSHCMGCGQCDKTGVCVLTGEPVGPGRKR